MDVETDAIAHEVDLAAKQIKAVEFEAELLHVKSTVNHTYNVTLNVPEYCLPQVKEMMGWLAEQVKVIVAKS